MSGGDTETSVEVAVRIRPQNSREQIDMCRICTFCTPDTPQIVLGKDKAFTYDFVFDTDTAQSFLYETCVQDLVKGCFDGYNATVLAYGQTGSGKTYSMGTGFELTFEPEELGVIPRAVMEIFSGIENRKTLSQERNEPLPQFEIRSQFLELYNEEIIDLFGEQNKGKLRIHEDSLGNIYVAGATEIKVSSEEETLACLKRGALSRTVGSTMMNAQSSRSHAIFTLLLTHQRHIKRCNSDEGSPTPDIPESSVSSESSEWETLKAKFHFVDLAGSERLKRTGATGERAKEGISINCGLLALGNVISALGDKAKKGSHVPYRDSKLTRFLQDSLGGNSKTLMIACISPTDRDFMETLNTLKYSNRARNIKNKVVVNQDKMSQQLSALRSRIQELEIELQEFRSGRMVVSEDGSVAMNDMASECTLLRMENDKLRLRVKALQQVIESQSTRLSKLTAEKEAAHLGHQDESTGQVLADSSSSDHSDQRFTDVLQGYISQIEDLKSRLIMSESLAHQNPQSPFRRAPSTMLSHHYGNPGVKAVPFNMDNMETEDLLKVAKNDIEKLKEKGKKESSLDTRSRKVVSDQDPLKRSVELQAEHFAEGDSSNEDSSDDMSDDTEAVVNSSDDSESDRDETESLASSIAELSSEINLKQQLVDQLEKAQRNFYTMKSQYEDKMQLLQHQIKSIETERDRVLKEISSNRSNEKYEEKTKEIKTKYERQLTEVKIELKSLKTARKEHAKAMKKNAQHENELKLLKNELLDMKKQRVKMLTKMREEANKRKVADARVGKEMMKLQKESRNRDHKIKTLESDARRRELVLKRRQEELSAMRREKRQKHSQGKVTATQSAASMVTQHGTNPDVQISPALSPIIGSNSISGTGYTGTVTLRPQTTFRESAGAIQRSSRRRMSSVFSSDSARKKWRDLEKRISSAIMKRQTMAHLAKDMDAWIEKRDLLSSKIDELKRQKRTASKSKTIQAVELASIEEDIDSISANIDYVQENIVELQNDLIVVDDTKSDGDTVDAHSIITASSPRESKYLLEHILDLALNLGLKASQNEAETKMLKARLKASEQSAEIIKSLSSPQVSFPIISKRNVANISKQVSPSSFHQVNQQPPPGFDLDTNSELSSDTFTTCNSSPQNLSPNRSQERGLNVKSRRRTALSSDMPVNEAIANSRSSSSSSKSRSGDRSRQHSDPPSSSAEDNMDGEDSLEALSRTRTASGENYYTKRKGLKKSRSNTSNSLDISPNTSSSCPSSPNVATRSLKNMGSEVNVWSRLATSTNQTDSSKGSILAEKPDPRKIAGKVLYCTHTACGHGASVLSLYSTQNYLFSGSQDRTVKVWNLKTCTELLTLDRHFSYVRCVRFCPKNNLIFTASQSLIKLWDMRHHRARCIKTFGPPGGTSSAESTVQDLLVSPSGNRLYSASGNYINIWDLKSFTHLGRLVGHNGAVCTLAVKGDLMATGARDRLIKIYDLRSLDPSVVINQPSICTLYPPHYDAISSLALYKELLFSSCGVTIKQWDIKERTLKQAVDGAHSQGNNINALAAFSSPITPLLVSGCKGGLLKMWNPDNCSSVGEIIAHKQSINTIATNSTCIFTGSSDKTIRIWRPSPQD